MWSLIFFSLIQIIGVFTTEETKCLDNTMWSTLLSMSFVIFTRLKYSKAVFKVFLA